jgi:hypothetical protein
MDLWMKIASALFLIMMIAVIWPRANQMMKERHKAQPGDWQAALIPILLVVGFVALLMYLV